MDINMPVLDGVEATRLILKDQDNIGIIILTMYPCGGSVEGRGQSLLA